MEDRANNLVDLIGGEYNSRMEDFYKNSRHPLIDPELAFDDIVSFYDLIYKDKFSQLESKSLELVKYKQAYKRHLIKLMKTSSDEEEFRNLKEVIKKIDKTIDENKMKIDKKIRENVSIEYEEKQNLVLRNRLDLINIDLSYLANKLDYNKKLIEDDMRIFDSLDETAKILSKTNFHGITTMGFIQLRLFLVKYVFILFGICVVFFLEEMDNGVSRVFSVQISETTKTISVIAVFLLQFFIIDPRLLVPMKRDFYWRAYEKVYNRIVGSLQLYNTNAIRINNLATEIDQLKAADNLLI